VAGRFLGFPIVLPPVERVPENPSGNPENINDQFLTENTENRPKRPDYVPVTGLNDRIMFQKILLEIPECGEEKVNRSLRTKGES